jgi:hypothetical protein
MSGLNMSDSARQELFESPFGAYWTSKIFIQQILGFTNVFNPYADIGALDANSKIIANTSLNQDFNPQDIKIFASSLEFQPHFYLKRISKNIFIDNRNDVLINLGNKNTYFERPIYRDKNFIDPPLSINNLIRNYGFLSGDDALYESNLIGSNLVGYKFNRNGSFIYQIDFFKPSDVQISFDFWEQWNHKVGERVFNLDISWDGESWSRVGEIDPTLINVHSPFSVIVQKKSVSKFLFRISKTASSVDIPFINSIRISELGQ